MIGAIADDFTGGTDVAVAFRRAGLRTVILFGPPIGDIDVPAADAVVVSLKSRTIPAAVAVQQSLDAAAWLRARGARQLFFKFCSTFDSTPKGNIGPVADALADLAGSSVTVVVPSSPGHDRRQFMGHLFVGTQLLSESSMRHHPVTPMTDSFIPRVLRSQTSRQVALLDHRTVQDGAGAIAETLIDASRTGERYVVVDAVSDADLAAIGEAVVDAPLVTGGAGLAGGLGAAVARRGGIWGAEGSEESDPVGRVRAVVLAGSCSARTLEQIAEMRRCCPSYRLDAVASPHAGRLAEDALEWFDALPQPDPVLIYSSLPAEELRATQEALGADRASRILEGAMALIAQGLIARDVRRLVVAGGETAGAVVSALDVGGGVIGSEPAPGVPWIFTTSEPQRALLLKSGNFGARDLLLKAVQTGQIQGATHDHE
ncbi:four-carbon acid sugar kinase family protein [Okibacterium endophyticum]